MEHSFILLKGFNCNECLFEPVYIGDRYSPRQVGYIKAVTRIDNAYSKAILETNDHNGRAVDRDTTNIKRVLLMGSEGMFITRIYQAGITDELYDNLEIDMKLIELGI